MLLFSLLDFAIGLYELGLVIFILCSWLMHPVAVDVRRWLSPAYEPLLAPIRRWVPAPGVGHMILDLSPLVLLVLLGLIRRVLIALFF